MERHSSRLSRRQFVMGAGATGLLAGCGRISSQEQRPTNVPRIGYLACGAPSASTDAFREGLRDLGYVDGQNVVVEWRLADGRLDWLPEAATELVSLPVDLVVATGPPAIHAARQATSTIPIIMTASTDPVGLGFVASLARPGGNVTGLSTFATELSAKRLELLATASGASHVAVIWDPNDTSHAVQLTETESAARLLGVQLQSLAVPEASAFEGAFDAAIRERAGALIALYDGLTFAHRVRITDFALASRLPAMYDRKEFVEAGGLMSYGVSYPGLTRRAAYYVDRILRGANPADLPVEQPMTFDFVVNMKTAQALGITFPNEIMLQVTDVTQ